MCNKNDKTVKLVKAITRLLDTVDVTIVTVMKPSQDRKGGTGEVYRIKESP